MTSRLLPLFFLFFAQFVHAQSLPERLRTHLDFLAADSLDGRGLGTAGKQKAALYIAESFRNAGLAPFDDDYFQEFFIRISMANMTGTNVIGVLEGSDPELKKEYIVLGAHYDHVGYEMKNGQRVVYNGADDNASGTAGLMELVRILSGRRAELKRSIIFIAFDGEESGLLGSKAFASSNGRFTPAEIEFMFSMDMIGMYKSYNGLDLKGIGTLDNGPEMASEAAKRHDIRLKNVSSEVESRTDTWSFAERGIPTAHAFTGLKSPYHKPEDDAPGLEYDDMARVVEYMADLTAKLSSEKELRAASSFKGAGKGGVRVQAGALAGAGSSFFRNDAAYFNAKKKAEANIGLFGQLHLGKRITLQAEALYDFNGSDAVTGTVRRHSFTAPVTLQLNLLSQSGGQVRMYPFAGAYYRQHLQITTGNEIADAPLFADTETGITFGLGMDVMKFHVALTFRRDMTGVYTDEDNTFGSGAVLNVGYKFGGGL